ncbi:uncharacterized protein [Arachis hypogaea]|uniref:uncharacterized protein n=1 Tax=Arachis hypogaea TaxID=3818 RepID=UPI003B2198C4
MLTSPQILQSPEVGKPLYLYLSVSSHAISSALVLETGKTQKPVYFVSKVLQPTEQRYPMVEQLALALITTARRLRHYFQSHTIIVRTDQPLRQILAKPEVAGRLIKWSIELSEFDIQYQPRPALKSQILADFIAEFTCLHNITRPSTGMMYVDGASNNNGSGAGIILEYENTIIEQSVRFSFEASNNQAEYEALLAGLNLAIKLQIPRIVVHCDSLLIVQQVNGSFQVKDPILERYWNMVRNLISTFDNFKIIHVPRGNNQRADILSKLATSRTGTSPKLSQLKLEKPSVNLTYILSMSQEPDWRAPITDYILYGTIPTSETNPKLFRRQASFYVLVGAELYRRGFSQPLLKCLSKKESAEAMDEVHEGVCGNHIGGKILAAKLLRAGYYWPTIRRDCIDKVKHATIMHSPAEVLHNTEVSWPFFRWGIDILGPFPTAPGQVKFLLVCIDYFSKWIEAQPLARITVEKVQSFLWKNIICRYGIPGELITDNGRQFTDSKLASFLQNFHVKHHFSSVEHPQTNGQAEVANRIILMALKKKLGEAKGQWADLVSEVLWSYNTTIHSATGETPFKLVYGAEAMIPVEIVTPTIRAEHYTQTSNDQARATELDTIEEVRNSASLKQRALQQLTQRQYNRKVIPRAFQARDLVLRKTEEARRTQGHGKLAALGTDHIESTKYSAWGLIHYKH